MKITESFFNLNEGWVTLEFLLELLLLLELDLFYRELLTLWEFYFFIFNYTR